MGHVVKDEDVSSIGELMALKGKLKTLHKMLNAEASKANLIAGPFLPQCVCWLMFFISCACVRTGSSNKARTSTRVCALFLVEPQKGHGTKGFGAKGSARLDEAYRDLVAAEKAEKERLE